MSLGGASYLSSTPCGSCPFCQERCLFFQSLGILWQDWIKTASASSLNQLRYLNYVAPFEYWQLLKSLQLITQCLCAKSWSSRKLVSNRPSCVLECWSQEHTSRQPSDLKSHWRETKPLMYVKICTMPPCFLSSQAQSLIRTWLSEQNHRLLTVWLWTFLISTDQCL